MPIQIQIKAPDVQEFLKKMQKFPQDAIDALNLGVNKSVLLLEREVKPITPVKTGRLRNAYRRKFTTLQGVLFNPVKYAGTVHDLYPAGTRYRNPSKNKRAVAGFMKVAANRVQIEVEDIFKDEMDKALEKTEVN